MEIYLVAFSFTMHGCREVLRTATTAIHIELQVNAIESAVSENPGLAADLSKSLIETICKTILKDRGVEVKGSPDAPELFKEVLRNMKLLPERDGVDKRVPEGLEKTVRGLIQAVQGLSEVRNSAGFASHGRDAYQPQLLEAMQAILVAQSADTIVHFLYSVHKANLLSNGLGRIRYEDNQDFNDFTDELHDAISIFNFTFKPSEVLFKLDEVGYRVAYTDYQEQSTNEEL
jgi:hypothetical protein